MLIALLAVLGVNLIVVVALLAFVLLRKRWVKRQPGSFHGVIRVSSGEIDGLRAKWGRGFGRWVRDVLVWTKAPFFFRNELVPADSLDQQRPARPGEVKRLGDHASSCGSRSAAQRWRSLHTTMSANGCSAHLASASTERWPSSRSP
jgi:hypothetical protein